MPRPTFQLLLDFSKQSVWPFENFTDHEDMSKLVSELKLGVDEELDRPRLKAIIQEYHRRFRPRRVFTDQMADRFTDVVIEIRNTFGDTLTKEAVAVLHRDGLAPKQPRNIVRI
jgi:hypothetical protein